MFANVSRFLALSFLLFCAACGGAMQQDARSISPAQALSQQQAGEVIIVDVRNNPPETVAGAINVPYTPGGDDEAFRRNVTEAAAGKRVALLCKIGLLAGKANKGLEHAGYLQGRVIAGGLNNWKREGLQAIPSS